MVKNVTIFGLYQVCKGLRLQETDQKNRLFDDRQYASWMSVSNEIIRTTIQNDDLSNKTDTRRNWYEQKGWLVVTHDKKSERGCPIYRLATPLTTRDIIGTEFSFKRQTNQTPIWSNFCKNEWLKYPRSNKNNDPFNCCRSGMILLSWDFWAVNFSHWIPRTLNLYNALTYKHAGLWLVRLPGNLFDNAADRRIGEAS